MASRRRRGTFPGALGTGERFAACVETMSARRDVRDPKALCAAIGRRKYGKAGFAALSHRGRARRNPSSVDGYVVVLWQDLGEHAGPRRTVLYDGTSRASSSRTYRDASHTVTMAKRDNIARLVQFYALARDERGRVRNALVDEHWSHGRKPVRGDTALRQAARG